MKEIKIYALIDVRTNDIKYIGKTIQSLNKRLSSHYSIKDDDLTHRANWIRELKKVNLKPIIKLIEIVTDDNWEEREIYWIEYYSKIFKLTNTDKGGRGSHKTDIDFRLKKSISSKKMWSNPDFKEKMKIALKDTHSEESKNKQSNIMKDKWSNEEYKSKMSKISKQYNTKRKKPKEIKYPNISESQKKLWHDEEHRKYMINKQPNRKIVICEEVEYESIGLAAKALSVYKSTIIKRVNSVHFPNYYYKKVGD